MTNYVATSKIRGVRFGGVYAWRKRRDNALMAGLPMAGTIVALCWYDHFRVTIFTCGVFLLMHMWAALGVSLGLHRLFTHRSFKASPWLRACLAVGSCFSLQGRIIRWAADHRRHHKHQDNEGDVHSPFFTARGRRLSRLRGFAHSHFAWIFDNSTTDAAVYAPDLLDDPLIAHFERFYWFYCALSFVFPWVLGFLLGGWDEGLRCLVWAGAVRIAITHQGTWAINSFCHSVGCQDFKTGDSSRNNWILGVLMVGEGWHNNHHMFPGSAYLGLFPHQPDLGRDVLKVLRVIGSVTDVVVVTPPQIASALAKNKPIVLV